MSGTIDPKMLELFVRSYSDPGLVKEEDRRLLWWGELPWERFVGTLAHFVERTLAESPGDQTRRRLHGLLTGLHVRASLLPEELMRSLGVLDAQAAVVRAIHAAFPVAPRVGRPLGVAVLDDELAFRSVPEAELDAAWASAESLDWRKIPDAEIERAFDMNSVYIWLDESSLPFYLPAFLCYSLRFPSGSCEFYTLLMLLQSTPTGPTGGSVWTHDQLRAIAGFLTFVTDDEPWDSLLDEHRESLSAWRALAA